MNIFNHAVARCVFGFFVLGSIDACSFSPSDEAMDESAQAITPAKTTSTEALEAGVDADADAPEAAPAKPAVKRTNNVRAPIWGIRGGVKKADALKDLGAPTLTQLPNARPIATSSIAMGGEWIVVDKPPAGYSVGTDGAGPCVGVIIIAGDKVYVFHFTATDDPAATLAAAGPFPPGSHAALLGGDGCDESNATLGSAIAGLKKQGVTIDGYSNSSGLHVRDGVFIKYKFDNL